MASSVFYNGRRHITPATISQVNDEDMAPRNLAASRNLAIVGLALAGEPGKPFKVNSPEDAVRKLRGGELLVAARKAFGPSGATGGPRTITVVRVGNATQATLTLDDASAADSLVLKAVPFGILGNGLKVKVAAGTLRGKKFTAQLGNEHVTGDNLARNAFTIRYAGALASATLDVTAADAVLKAGAVGTEAVVATISFTDFPTVQQVCDRINTVADFSAVPAPQSELRLAGNALDFVTAQNVKTADFVVKADLQAMIDYINGAAFRDLVKAERAVGAGAVPANVDWTYLAGATDLAATNTDWANAIDALENVDVQRIVPLTADPAIHSMVDAHVHFMSDAARRERRAVVGGAAGLDVEDVVDLPIALGSDRTSFAWPAHYDFDNRGQRSLLPGYMTAVLVAAAQCGVNPGTSLTNKPLRVGGLEFEARVPADTDELIQNGVLVVARAEGEDGDPEGFKVVRDISTWLSDDNYNRVENSCGDAVDFVARSLRIALDPGRGGKSTPMSMNLALSRAQTCLENLAKPEPTGPGVIVGDAVLPAFRNLAAYLNGDVTGINVQVSPVIPNNFILVGISVTPYSGTATLA